MVIIVLIGSMNNSKAYRMADSTICMFDAWCCSWCRCGGVFVSSDFCFMYAKNVVQIKPNKLTNGTRLRSGINE